MFTSVDIFIPAIRNSLADILSVKFLAYENKDVAESVSGLPLFPYFYLLFSIRDMIIHSG